MKTAVVLFLTIVAFIYYFSRTTANARSINPSKQELSSLPNTSEEKKSAEPSLRDSTKAPVVENTIIKSSDADLNTRDGKTESEAQERYENLEKDADFLLVRRRDDEEKSVHELQHVGIE